MPYVIKRQDGKFVKDMRYGGNSSYTTDILSARMFATPELAKNDLCPENETVCNVSDLLPPC